MQFAYYTLLLVLILVWFSLCVLLVNNRLKQPFFQLSINTNQTTVANYHFEVPTRELNKTTVKTKIRKYHIPKFMLEMYEKNKVRSKSLAKKADVIRSLIPKHAELLIENDIINEFSDNHLLIFDIPNSEAEEQFVEAELKILTIVNPDLKVTNGIEKHLKISVYDDASKTFHDLDKVHIYHLNNTWLSFNVTKPVVKILESRRSSQKLLKIVISVSNFLPQYNKNKSNFNLSLMPLRDDLEHDYPILLLSYSSNETKKIFKATSSRHKRSIEEDYEEETNKLWDNEFDRKSRTKKNKKSKNSCNRKPLYINFSEIKFDLWIVQPPGYEAYQCQGKCFFPVAEHLNPTKHAIVQALLHSVAPSRVSRSCCVPTDLDSISILYVDSSGVLTYRYAYKDMVVLECGCR